MIFQWDPTKASANQQKHGVSFDEASLALLDPLGVTLPDPDHSLSEVRMITIGCQPTGRLLAIAHTERGAAVRIISARKATRDERSIYEEHP